MCNVPTRRSRTQSSHQSTRRFCLQQSCYIKFEVCADRVAGVRTATEPKSVAGFPGWRAGAAGTPALQHLKLTDYVQNFVVWFIDLTTRLYSGPLHLADDAPAEALWHDGLALPEGEVCHAVASFGSQTVIHCQLELCCRAVRWPAGKNRPV